MNDHSSSPNINTSSNSPERNSSQPAPAFFGIIPADVLYNTELEPGAKLLYCSISGLTKQEGYCWASNEYLSKLFDVDISTIKRWIASLIEGKFIFITTDKNGIQWQRKIFLFERNQKMFAKAQNCAPPSSKMSHILVKTNTTSNLITSQSIDIKRVKEGGVGGSKPKIHKAETQKVSADASSLTHFFLSKIRERNPKFKEPNMQKWASQMDLLLRIDERTVEEVKQVIEWAHQDSWYKINCLSPENLRKNFDKMFMKMDDDQEMRKVKKNIEFTMVMKKKYPKELQLLSFNKEFVLNPKTGKQVSLKLDFEVFKDLLAQLFSEE